MLVRFAELRKLCFFEHFIEALISVVLKLIDCILEVSVIRFFHL